MTSTDVVRTLVAFASAGIVVLWIHLAFGGQVTPGAPTTPVSDTALPPVLLGVGIFSSLAVAAAVAAFRDAPVVVVLCGAISLVPVGLYTLLLPWPWRLVGILDIVLVVAGVFLLRGGSEPAQA